MRVAVNEHAALLNGQIASLFKWKGSEEIAWLSPIAADDYAEYFDESFLERLGVPLEDLRVPLFNFWPRGGPRWDGLARTNSGKLILVEAKAYIEEGVDFGSRASPSSLEKISEALDRAKLAYAARAKAPWPSPFYQYANRLAHLFFLRELNDLDAYLVFLYFADAPDVPESCSIEEWRGAVRLIEKSLGLGAHRFRDCVGTLICSVPEMLAEKDGSASAGTMALPDD